MKTANSSRLPGRLVLLAVFGFLYLPIAVLVALSFNEAGLPTSWSGFSFKWYAALAGNHEILGAAWNTLVVAVFATLISTALGTLLALGMETRRRKSSGLEALAFAPMVIPDIVLAVALLTFFSLLNVTLGLHTIVISHVIFDLAFVSSVVRARLKHFDYSIVEASRDLGASGWTTFWRVTFPVLLPASVAGGLLDEFGGRKCMNDGTVTGGRKIRTRMEERDSRSQGPGKTDCLAYRDDRQFGIIHRHEDVLVHTTYSLARISGAHWVHPDCRRSWGRKPDDLLRRQGSHSITSKHQTKHTCSFLYYAQRLPLPTPASNYRIRKKLPTWISQAGRRNAASTHAAALARVSLKPGSTRTSASCSPKALWAPRMA